MSTKAVVLSSGGLDSSTAVALAVKEFGNENVSTVSVTYGQKHGSKELACAEKIAEYYNVKHYLIDLSQIFKYSNCSLLNQSTEEVPEGSYENQQKNSETGVVSTYVPYRNGLMLSAVSSFGMSLYPDDEVHVYLGNHADDAAGNAYPDCSITFSNLISGAIYEGSGRQVIVETPFAEISKAGIVKKGMELKVPYELTWSCYNGRETACGKCGTCIDRIRAFRENGLEDPIDYEN